MGKNQNSVVVLQIRVKFWRMISMGVKYNHTKFEQETQRWRPGTGFASGGPQFLDTNEVYQTKTGSTSSVTLTLIKTEYWDRAGGGGNISYDW